MCYENAYYVILHLAATRAILTDIEVLENVGTITITVPRFGDLNLRSDGVLRHQSTSPAEAIGMSKMYKGISGL